jgi:hypothetical protein
MTDERICPICDEPSTPSDSPGYILNGERVVTCRPCRATLMQLVLEVSLHRRRPFIGKSANPEKLRTRIHAAVLEARRP